MHLYIVPCVQLNLQKEIHPGALPISRAKDFTLFSSKRWSICSFPHKRASRNSSKGLEVMLLGGVPIESAIVNFLFPFCKPIIAIL